MVRRGLRVGDQQLCRRRLNLKGHDSERHLSHPDGTLAEFLEDMDRERGLPTPDSSMPLTSLFGWFKTGNFL